ncbi:hypothetical protein WA026_004950 [Henosepilachna vigintioctopunctata]|uniref:Reverse transcriptase domain-containing protein n=1 Tax=Henosepilachna vigintioctopunctata TaxID=420089 RepID=A0AAW1UVM9_9CUCU
MPILRVYPLTDILNSCIQQGIFPDKMKIAKVCPILNGSTKDKNNYRSISIAPTFSKVLEMIMADQLVSYMDKSNYFCEEQFGFRKGRRTADGIESFYNFIVDSLEERYWTSVEFCDLSKAFDCMCHHICTEKLKYYGVRGVALSLFTSYLTDRRQMVKCGPVSSSVLNVEQGIPQGSILGSLLFIIYMNDLPKNLACHMVLYADDTCFALKDKQEKKLEIRYQQTMQTSGSWFRANKLLLNESNCKTMTFTTSRMLPSNEVKFLGVILDNRLTWRNHCHKLNESLQSSICAIRRVRKIISIEAAKTVYYGLFHSRMLYALELWGVTCHVKEILTSQKEALRAIEAVNSLCHCKPIFKKHRVLTVVAELILRLVMNVANNPRYEKRSACQPYNIRSNEDLNIGKARLTSGMRKNEGVKLFNRLPIQWRNLQQRVLRRTMKDYLRENPPYCLDEFRVEI